MCLFSSFAGLILKTLPGCAAVQRAGDGCVSQSVRGAAAEQKNGRKYLTIGTSETINSSVQPKPARGINPCQVSSHHDLWLVPFLNFLLTNKGAVANSLTGELVGANVKVKLLPDGRRLVI